MAGDNLCGDNGGRKANNKFCAARSEDDDGRCKWHPLRAEEADRVEMMAAIQESMGGVTEVLPGPEAPFRVAKVIGGPLHPDNVAWPPEPGVSLGEPLALVNWSGVWMAWDITHWREVEETEVNRLLYDRLGHAVYERQPTVMAPWNPNTRTVGYVRHALESHTLLPRFPLEPGACVGGGDAGGTFLSLANGLLDVGTMEFDELGHTPAFFNTHSIPFDYDPDAPEPALWLKCLGQWFADDAESIELVRLWFCAVLLGVTKWQKFVLLIGPGGSGKDVLRDVLTELLGKVNTCSIPYSQLGKDFGLESSAGKALLVVPDARQGDGDHATTLERLLAIVGEGHPAIPRKNKTDWTALSKTLVMFLSNVMVKMHDPSGAFGRRVLILRTRRRFVTEDGAPLPGFDADLKQKLRAEMGSILKWALSAADELDRVGLREPASSASDRALLKQGMSEMAVWAARNCMFGEGCEIEKDTLRSAYNTWREGPDLGEVEFGRQLVQVNGEIDTTGSRGTYPNRVYVYRGVRLLTEKERIFRDQVEELERALER